MSELSDVERASLNYIRSIKCAPGCPCEDWGRALADHLRRELPDADDITLARTTFIAAVHARGWSTAGADGYHVAGVLSVTAAELAVLELEHPGG